MEHFKKAGEFLKGKRSQWITRFILLWSFRTIKTLAWPSGDMDHTIIPWTIWYGAISEKLISASYNSLCICRAFERWWHQSWRQNVRTRILSVISRSWKSTRRRSVVKIAFAEKFWHRAEIKKNFERFCLLLISETVLKISYLWKFLNRWNLFLCIGESVLLAVLRFRLFLTNSIIFCNVSGWSFAWTISW